MTIELYKPNRNLTGNIKLSGSKSISNRALMIRALCDEAFPIHHIANAKDTQRLQALLSNMDAIIFDAGAAGTTFRFMTAYLAIQQNNQVLTGSERMKQRPIGVLVDALNELGANIEYLEKEGYPPLLLKDPDELGKIGFLSIPASTSSQYISALLLIAPTLPNGLTIQLKGKIVSRPYIEMTLKLMEYFGVSHQWKGNQIDIDPKPYQPTPFTVEADWSAASYYYAMAVLADQVDLQLDGLFKESTQGDAILAEMMTSFGIKTTFNTKGIRLQKDKDAIIPTSFENDFLKCPDLAQTLAVACAGVGTTGLFTGLETLRIKETDRIAALKKELNKVGVNVMPSKDKADYYEFSGQAKIEKKPPVFATYEDHRMAMAFAPLAMLAPIQIAEPDVVVKSYPQFWDDLKLLGYEIKEI